MKFLLLPTLLAFFTTYFILPYAIRYFKFVGLVTTDVHKRKKPKIPYSAGLPALAGILVGLFAYISIQVFVYNSTQNLLSLFAATTSLLIITYAGLIDDLNSAQVKVRKLIEGKRGIKRWQKPLLTLPAAIPLMAIMAGTSKMALPFLGEIDFGIFYPLLLIPIGVVGAANMINMLGGFNGLESGMGLIYTFSLGTFALMIKNEIAAILFFTTFASLFATFKFNFYPAKILAGDSLTYLLGAIVAVGAIIGNMERAAILTLTPFLLQGLLKFYSFFKMGEFASDLGILQKDGSIKPRYDKIYSLTHLVMRIGNFNEKQIVFCFLLLQIFFSSLPFLKI